MTKLTGAALDRAVANAMGLKSVRDCEKWGEQQSTAKSFNPLAAGPQAFYGFPDGPVSAPKVGGNDLTVGETTPFRLTEENIDPNQWAFDNGLEST